MAESLARNSSALEATKNYSWKKCLVQKLDLAAKVTNYELAAGEPRLWESVLEDCSAAEVEIGFSKFFRGAVTFMPKPGEIRALILQHRSDRKAEAETCKTEQMLKENREARETGKTVSFGEILQRIKTIATEKAMPTAKDSTKQPSTKPLADAP